MIARVKPVMVERVKRRVQVKEQYGAPPPGIYGGAIECKHCNHWYLNPCTDEKKDGCQNYLYLQTSNNKKKGKKK